MRIFTPGTELPMAGHPMIGSTFALAELGVIATGRASFVFGLGVGPTKVELTWEGDRLSFAWMDQRPPEFREPASPRSDIIRAVGLEAAAVDATGLPIEEVSCGNAFLLIPVRTRAAVDAAEADLAAMRKLKSAFPGGHVGALFFTTEPIDPKVTVYSRMFAPSAGVVEDPATGSAAGPLGSYLVKHGLVHRNQMQRHGQPAGRRDGPSEPPAHAHHGDRRRDHARAGGRQSCPRRRGHNRSVIPIGLLACLRR